MTKIFGAVCAAVIVVVVGIAALTPGCQIRGKRIAETALDRLDKVLGEMDVQRAEIERGIKAGKQAVDGIRQARLKAESLSGTQAEYARPYEDKVAKYDQALRRLRDYLKAGKPVEIAGKTYTVRDLGEMTDQALDERKQADARATTHKTASQALRKVAAKLAQNEEAVEGRVVSLQTQVANIDAELVAARAMKEASAHLGDGDATLLHNLDALQDKVANLQAEVKVQTNFEQARASGRDAESQLGKLPAFIQDTQGSKDRLAALDQVLGAK
jgi:phage shock protein A